MIKGTFRCPRSSPSTHFGTLEYLTTIRYSPTSVRNIGLEVSINQRWSLESGMLFLENSSGEIKIKGTSLIFLDFSTKFYVELPMSQTIQLPTVISTMELGNLGSQVEINQEFRPDINHGNISV